MNKTQLVNYVSRKTRIPRKDAWVAVDTTLDCIKRYTKTREGVKLSGFGNFRCVQQKPERKWNARTRKYHWTKPQKQVWFNPTKAYRDYVMK